MALDDAALRAHLNMTADDSDELDAAVLPRVLAAAKGHVEMVLGYKLTDEAELPEGVPSDLEEAVLMLAAHFYKNRQATVTGVVMMAIPFGVAQILGEHRRYSFG